MKLERGHVGGSLSGLRERGKGVAKIKMHYIYVYNSQRINKIVLNKDRYITIKYMICLLCLIQ